MSKKTRLLNVILNRQQSIKSVLVSASLFIITGCNEGSGAADVFAESAFFQDVAGATQGNNNNVRTENRTAFNSSSANSSSIMGINGRYDEVYIGKR